MEPMNTALHITSRVSMYLTLIFSILFSSANGKAPVFSTTPGTGPDKWASVWLLRRYVSPTPVLISLKDKPAIKSRLEGEVPAHVVRFDAPGAIYDRTATSTTYSEIQEAFTIDDNIAQRMGELVREIEIDAWRAEPSLESRVLEQAFRGMQLKFGREEVTQDCYIRLFNAVALSLSKDELAVSLPSSLIPGSECLDDVPFVGEKNPTRTIVETLSLDATLRHVDDGARVVFLDTRERSEFEEGHIPGAINLTLRHIDEQTAKRFADADLVIAYCVKDFRGYEAAKALTGLGVPTAIMKPYGMRGWVDAGLPVAGREHLDESSGLVALRQRARQAAGRSVQVEPSAKTTRSD